MNGFTLLPRRARESHKGDYGKVCIIGGKVGFTGAPVLAALGALRTGAGLVRLGVPESVYPIIAGKCLCAMPFPLKSGETGGLCLSALPQGKELCGGADALLIGPGLGREPETARLVRELARWFPGPLVLDADGINALEGHIDVLESRRDKVTVLTPHDGEFARLLGRPLGEDKRGEASAFAMERGCYVVSKGHRTVVAAPDGTVYVNTTGNPGMASGGSGDVLAGMILSFLGQGFPMMDGVCTAVYLHGLAGDLAAKQLGEYAMTPADLVEFLPRAVKQIEEK